MAERRQQFTDPELVRALRALGPEVEYPPTPDLERAIRRRIAAQPRRPRPWWLPTPTTRWRLALALAVLVLVAAGILGALPPVRHGVANRLGLRNVEIVNVIAVPTPTGAPTITPTIAPTATALFAAGPPVTATPAPSPTPTALPTPTVTPLRAQLGTPTTLAAAQARVGFPIRVPALPAYRTPDEVYVGQPPPGGRVSLIYRARADLPAIPGADVGLLLSEFRGGLDAGFFGKGIPPGASVEPVTINGVQGYWIEGGMRTFFYRDPNGQFTEDTIRVAGNTLLWERDGIVYRLETSLPKDEAVRIAASVS